MKEAADAATCHLLGRGSAGTANRPREARLASYPSCERPFSPVSASLYTLHSFAIPSGFRINLNVYTAL